MQNDSKLKLTMILSVSIHIGAIGLLYKLANQISFLHLVSITNIDLAAQETEHQLNTPPQQKIAKNINTGSAQTTQKQTPHVISSVSELGSDEISNQSQISSPAKLISVVRAQRTPEAKKANYVADAKVLIIVNQQGVVDSAKLLNNLEYGLNEVALDIAKKLKFRPAKIGPNAVRTQIELTINFKSSN